MLLKVKLLTKLIYGNAIVAIFYCSLLAISLYFLSISLYGAYAQYRTSNWLSCDGVIIAIIEPDYDSDGAVRRYSEVEYGYEIGQGKFRSKRIDFSIANPQSWDIVGGKAPGQHVEVFYNPNNLSSSVLSKKMEFNAKVIFSALLLLLFSIWPILIYLAKLNNGKGLWKGFDFKEKRSSGDAWRDQ